ncbi:hypothetical protein HBB16_14360 [Pseudonocardia sp. MCCB 268]|nr:hypothetical protein [Pseudonocardia cytotoxica]
MSAPLVGAVVGAATGAYDAGDECRSSVIDAVPSSVMLDARPVGSDRVSWSPCGAITATARPPVGTENSAAAATVRTPAFERAGPERCRPSWLTYPVSGPRARRAPPDGGDA